ncbi:MAG: ABC transporter substrate-binding protein [Acidimicrobiales bacterium]
MATAQSSEASPSFHREAAKVASTARTGKASCPGGKVTLTEEDYYQPPSKTNIGGNNFSAFFKSYSASHSCVNVVREAPVTSGDGAYLTHVLSQFSSGSQPDLLMLDNPQLGEFAADNVLVPLSSLGSLPVLKRINPANVAETTYGGKLYALPLYTNTIAIFYNKTLLKENGITTLPRTWAQFSADAKKTAHGSDQGFVFSGQAGPGQATWQFDPWAWSNGGSMSDPSGTASVQALTFLTSLVKEGAAPKSVVNWTQAQPIQEFEAGKAAFCENGLWNIPALDQQFPKLKWGVFEIPTRVAGQTVVAPFGGEVWSIPKTNPTAEKAAFALLQAMSGNLVAFAKVDSAVPTVPTLWRQSPWNTSVYAPFLAELKHGRSRTAGFVKPANEPTISLDIGNEIEASLIGKVSPAQAMQAAQSQIASLLK